MPHRCGLAIIPPIFPRNKNSNPIAKRNAQAPGHLQRRALVAPKLHHCDTVSDGRSYVANSWIKRLRHRARHEDLI